jgi:hypothetical protein
MKAIPVISFAVLILIVPKLILGIYKALKKKRLHFIKTYAFHPVLKDKVREKYPHLSEEDADVVMAALRDYFIICRMGNHRLISMPSKVADVAWHEFILCTRWYDEFCKKAFGRFLHHTPNVAMKSPNGQGVGLQRAWKLACMNEKINPQHPTKHPLLFGIDAQLHIPDGLHYSLDPKDPNATHFAKKTANSLGLVHRNKGSVGTCAAGCASSCGGDSSGCSGDSSGCGGDSGGCGGCGGD